MAKDEIGDKKERLEMDGRPMVRQEHQDGRERGVTSEDAQVGCLDSLPSPVWSLSSQTRQAKIDDGQRLGEDGDSALRYDAEQRRAGEAQSVSPLRDNVEAEAGAHGSDRYEHTVEHHGLLAADTSPMRSQVSLESLSNRERSRSDVSPLGEEQLQLHHDSQATVGTPEQWIHDERDSDFSDELYDVSPPRSVHSRGGQRSDRSFSPDYADERAGYEDEERDVSTPIPLGIGGSNYFDINTSPASMRQTNGWTTPTTHEQSENFSYVNSTPNSARHSNRSASNSLSFAKKPRRNSRVRYSWQSASDEEPNRPRIHVVKLYSNTANASAAFPQGEAFGFSVSPRGHKVAAYNSARLYILDTAALPVGVTQDYALKRRPLAVEIVDDGDMLAILSDEHTVNLYDLGHQQLQRTRTVKTDFPTTCIALAPSGGLLATAYEGGIEIWSLDPNAMSTDRRAVRSQKMDRLYFSEDGSTLLGTTTRIHAASTVIVSVPLFPSSPDGVPTHEELREAWCADALHPENIRNSSHASYMRESSGVCNDQLFAWNGLADTFGILNASDLQYGNMDFPVVISPPLSTCGGLGAAIHSCPAVDEQGDTVAMIVNDRTVRLYIVPPRPLDQHTPIEAHSIDHELDEGYGCPFTDLRWLYDYESAVAPTFNSHSQIRGRLIVMSPGGIQEPSDGEEDVEGLEGGRIILFDFDPHFVGQAEQTFRLILGSAPPQLLEEPAVDVADEVALVRRRTVNQQRNALSQRPATLGRAASTFGNERDKSRPSPNPDIGITTSKANRLAIHNSQSNAARSLPDLMEISEALDTFEEPYALNAPRSQASLQRAATNAQRHRFQALEERHRSSVAPTADEDVPQLPEYTEEPNAPLPSRFRALAGLYVPPVPMAGKGSSISPPPQDGHPIGPMTAPPDVGESFSAEQAFAIADQARVMEADAQRQIQPTVQRNSQHRNTVSRSHTFSPAASGTGQTRQGYGSAASRASPQIGVGPAPALIGDWENVRPVRGVSQRLPTSQAFGGASRPDNLPPPQERNSPSLIRPSPQLSRPHTSWNSPIQPTTNDHQTHGPPLGDSRTPSPSNPLNRLSHRRPRNPTLTQNSSHSASLFPNTQPNSHVPHRTLPPKPGTVGHPVTNWTPPAPSSSPAASGSGLGRAHSRRGKGAFPNTSKAKSLGFFNRGMGSRRGRKKDGLDGQGTGAGAQVGGAETGSIGTGGKKESKCAVM